MTTIAWIVRHAADTTDTRPAVYFTAAEAEAHAAQFVPGVAVVVPLGDVAAERERCAKLCDDYQSGGQEWGIVAAVELAREIRNGPRGGQR